MRITKRRVLHAIVKAAFGITSIVGGGGILLGEARTAIIGTTLTAALRIFETLVNWDNVDETLRMHFK